MLFCQQHVLLVGFWTPKWTPTLVPKLLKMESKSGHIFKYLFLICGLRVGSMFGAILDLERAMMCQDGPKKDLKSLKVPKSSNCPKCDFTEGKPNFLSLGGSQDEHKKLKTALKRHLKCFKTRKIKVPKLAFFLIFWTGFGADLGPKTDPNIYRK